ncbi:hypothetical protein BH23PAT2_BH23PAT2_00740 [soil metagenome]
MSVDAKDVGALTIQEKKFIQVMQLLGDPTRYKMFKLLMSGKEMCVTEIAAELGVTVSAASQHFRNFELQGLVDKERIGQKICYSFVEGNDLVVQLINLHEANAFGTD